MILFPILWNDILPLFVFIGAGWFLDSKFKIDISTYSKLTILVVLPCFIFYSLYGYRGSGMEMAAVAAAVLLLLVQFLLSGGLGRFFTSRRESSMNSGRYPPFPIPAISALH